MVDATTYPLKKRGEGLFRRTLSALSGSPRAGDGAGGEVKPAYAEHHQLTDKERALLNSYESLDYDICYNRVHKAESEETTVSALPCNIRREGGQSLVIGGSSLVTSEGKACNHSLRRHVSAHA